MLHHETQFPLTDLPRVLRENGVIVKYHTCWRHATEGRIPAHRLGGRWFIDTANLDQIAAAFTSDQG